MYDKFSIKALKNTTFNIFTHQAYISSNISSTSCDRGYQGFLFGGGGDYGCKMCHFFFITLTGKSIWHSFYIYVIIYVISSSGKGAIYHQFELKIKVISPIQITDKTPHDNNYQYSSQYVKTFKLI